MDERKELKTQGEVPYSYVDDTLGSSSVFHLMNSS